MPNIRDARILILATDGFEQLELTVPRDELRKKGAKVSVATPTGGSIRGWNKTDWGETAPGDLKIADARPDDFDALILPGGVMNPDKLRIDPSAMRVVKSFLDQRQARRRDLPCALAARAGGRRPQPENDVLQVDPQGRRKRRRALGERGGHDRRRDHHEPQPGRFTGVRCENH